MERGTVTVKTSTRTLARGLVIGSLAAMLFFGLASADAQDLIGSWTGDGNALDSSVNHNNGSFGGTFTTDSIFGKVFDLSTAKVSIPDISAYNFTNYPTGWTVGFWFNTNGNASSQMGFLGQDNGPGYQPKWFVDYGYTVYGSNTDFIWHVNDYNQERIFLGSNSVQPFPSGWNQLTVTTSPQDVTFYLNGQNIGETATPSYMLETTAPLMLGATEGSLNYNGLMADVTLWAGALSSAQAAQLATLPAATPEPSSVFVFGIGLGCLLTCARRSRRMNY